MKDKLQIERKYLQISQPTKTQPGYVKNSQNSTIKRQYFKWAKDLSSHFTKEDI